MHDNATSTTDSCPGEPGEPPSAKPPPASGGEGAGDAEPLCPSDSDPARLEILDPRGLLARAPVAWILDRGHAVLRELGLPGEVRARLVDDAEMTREHAAHLGDPRTTDVITFDLADRAGVLDVDLLVCVDEAARQAGERGHAVEREVLLYIVHGVLHCAGEDDRDEASSARMHAREDGLLEAAGVGAVYAPRGTGA